MSLYGLQEMSRSEHVLVAFADAEMFILGVRRPLLDVQDITARAFLWHLNVEAFNFTVWNMEARQDYAAMCFLETFLKGPLGKRSTQPRTAKTL